MLCRRTDPWNEVRRNEALVFLQALGVSLISSLVWGTRCFFPILGITTARWIPTPIPTSCSSLGNQIHYRERQKHWINFQCGLDVSLPSLLPWERPGSGMELWGDVPASSPCPAPLPKFGRRKGVSVPELLQLTGCSLGTTPKINLPSPPGGKAPKGGSSCF